VGIMKARGTLIIVSFVLALFRVEAATYYFSSLQGDDSRTAVQAQNENTPWRSIEKLNNIMGSLSPGDKILFKRGEVFFGTIKITKSGSSTLPIVFGAYGSGTKPVLTGMQSISKWTSIGNGIFVSNLETTVEGRVNIVTVDSQIQEMGRFPNFNDSNKGFKIINSSSSSTQLSSSDFGKNENWSGAEIIIRKNPWVHDRHVITNNNSGNINFTDIQSKYPVTNGYGFFIQNHIKTLDQYGEWYYDINNKKLYIYFGNQTNFPEVDISTKNNLIELTWKVSHIEFNELEMRGANGTGILINEGTHVQVKNSTIKYMGEYAVRGIISNHLTVENCEIDFSLNNALYAENTSQNITFKNNLITNTYPFIGMANSGDLNGQAIYTSNRSHNGLIENNKVFNTGYIGINFGGDNSVARKNYIKDFCIHKTDGGGIYIWEGWDNKNSSGRIIEDNIIVNGLGYSNGTNKHGLIDPIPVEGIYIDDNTSGVLIQNNTITNISKHGIYLHNARNIKILDNLFYNAFEGIYLNHDQYGDPVRDIIIERNRIFSITEGANFINTSSIKEDEAEMGSFNSNFYIRPFENDFGFLTKYLNQQTWEMKSQLSNLKSWNKDPNGKLSPINHQAYSAYTEIGSNLFPNGKFDSNGNNTFCKNCSILWKNTGDFQDGHIAVNTEKDAEINFSLGKMKPETSYMLKFKIKGSTRGNLEIFIREAQTPWKTLSGSKGAEINDKITAFEIPFFNKVGAEKANLIIKSGVDNFNFSIDDFEIIEANIAYNEPEDYLFFAYNATGTSQKQNISGNYVDAYNIPHFGSIDIPPFSAIALIKVSNDEEKTPQPPTVTILNPKTNAEIKQGNKVSINIDAKSEHSEIKQVEIYLNDKLLKTLDKIPYTHDHIFENTGIYLIKAKAIDQQGQETTSTPIQVNVEKEAISPTISWLTPAPNDFFFVSDPIKLSVISENEKQNIVKIDFSINNNVVGTVNNVPYQITVPNLPLGVYNLSAKATNSDGLEGTTETITIKVIEVKNIPPTVTIISPGNNVEFTQGDVISIKAIAEDSDGTISKVEFYIGNTLIGTDYESPYNYNWGNAGNGKHNITARATDNHGAVTTSDVIQIQVKQRPKNPKIRLILPKKEPQFIEGDILKLAIEILEESTEISKVTYYKNDILLGSRTNGDFTFNWKADVVGDLLLTAVATDINGVNTTDERLVSIFLKENKLNRDLNINDFKIGPNPTSQYLNLIFNNIETTYQMTAEVVSLDGRTTKNFAFELSENEVTLDLLGLSPGLYLLRIHYGGEIVITKKFIMKN
jgi:parallel beta-helix repeat protein